MTIETFVVEAVGVVGFLTNVWANLLLARKTEAGWVVRLFANGLWLVYGIAIVSIANILSSVVFAGINIYGWNRWHRERLQPRACDECAARTARELADAQAVIAAVTRPVVVSDEDRAALERFHAKLDRYRLRRQQNLYKPSSVSVVGEIDVALRKEAPRDELHDVALSSDTVAPDGRKRS